MKNPDYWHQLGQRLRAARLYCGFTQEEVANHLGICRSAVVLMEKGSRRVDLWEFERLAALYKVDDTWLRGLKDASADIPADVIQLLEGVSSKDRETIEEFVQHLHRVSP